MLSNQTIAQFKQTIVSDVRFTDAIIKAQSFSGKEGGHSMAPVIEDLICQILVQHMGAVKPTKARSLSDIIFDNHLINVKFGTPTISAKDKRNKTLDNILYSTKITPNYGQPNMCSMKRIMKAFYKTSQIDSYYIIKVSVLPTSYSLHVFDMFDFIDYLTWNSGTGQIMLKENKFYQDIDTFVPNFTIQEKKDKLNNLYNSGSKDHILLRLKQYLDQSDDKQTFMNEVMSMFN